MGTKYVSVPKKFDTVAWSSLINRLINMFETMTEASAIAGVHPTTLGNWRDQNYGDEGFNHPSMSNFLRICNLMDADPADFFNWGN